MEYSNHELVALETFLAYWPDGMAYAQVIDHLHAEDYREDIDVLGDFEELDFSHIAQLIEGLHAHLLQTYGGK